MEFTEKHRLDKKFIAFGKFYELCYSNNKKEQCRSILDIYERSYYKTSKIKKVDAIFIMMNPGASEPKIKETKIKKLQIEDVKNGKLKNIKFVETIPDKTQYQIMRIMKFNNWKYVKIINLSDLREAKSEVFYKKIQGINDHNNIHSIFSKDRKKELSKLFTKNKYCKIIVAWGVNTKLKNIIELALKNVNLNKRKGNSKDKYKEKKDFYYYHPLPRLKVKQIEWLEDIIKKL